MTFHDSALPGELLDRVAAFLPSMTRADVKIARKLLAVPEEFARSSVRAIADDLGISEPTIVRFCRTVGCEGFKDLKFRVIQELAFRQAQLDARQHDGHETPPAVPAAVRLPASETAARIHNRAIEALNSVAGSLDYTVIASAATIVARARKIVIYGLGGSSAVLAQEVHNRLFRLGIASTVAVDSYVQRMSAATLDHSDAAIFVSSTGRPRALQDSLELARYYHAQTIAITDRDSPVGRDADLCIHVGLSQVGVHEFQPNPMRYAQMLAIDLLAFEVAESLGPRAKAMLRQTRASVASLHGILPQQPIGD